MAGKTNGNRSKAGKREKHRPVRIAACIAFALCLLMAGVLTLTSSVTYVRRASVYLADLPEAFQGTKLLFVSDLDLKGEADLARSKRLFNRLQGLDADLLLLGGDYTSLSVLERLDGQSPTLHADLRRRFFSYIGTLDYPLGVYAVTGSNDGDSNAMRTETAQYGIELLDGQIRSLYRDGTRLTLVGIDPNRLALRQVPEKISHSDCVVALLRSPEQVAEAMTTESGDAGSWADLLLAGHTHGGQVYLFGKSVLPLSELEQRYRSGWYREIIPLLVSEGFGCQGLPIRINTCSEVWLIELRCENVSRET